MSKSLNLSLNAEIRMDIEIPITLVGMHNHMDVCTPGQNISNCQQNRYCMPQGIH
jgi:hypothetical protein